jgi:hypothetical protein
MQTDFMREKIPYDSTSDQMIARLRFLVSPLVGKPVQRIPDPADG